MNALNFQIFEWVHGYVGRYPFLDEVGIFFAEYAPYLVGIWFLVFLVRHTKDWRVKLARFAEVTIALVLARGIIVEAIRFFLPIARPFLALGLTPLISESSSAFPSAHAAIFFALATVTMFYRKKHGWWLLGFAAINGVARVFVGVHWPLDIVGGALVGILGALVAHILLTPYLAVLAARVPRT